MYLSWLDYAQILRVDAIQACGVAIYPDAHELVIAGKNVPCTNMHLRLLGALLSDFCKTVSCERLLTIDGRQLTLNELNRLRVQVCYLRRLLRLHGAALEIRTVRNYGYQARPIGAPR